jgi:hypothetical protein
MRFPCETDEALTDTISCVTLTAHVIFRTVYVHIQSTSLDLYTILFRSSSQVHLCHTCSAFHDAFSTAVTEIVSHCTHMRIFCVDDIILPHNTQEDVCPVWDDPGRLNKTMACTLHPNLKRHL